MKKNWNQKRIPTLLGLVVLVVGLVAGILFLGQGFGSFAPRATPQTSPKNVLITNVTDTTFTVSFITDESTTGFIKYGTVATALNQQVSDDRDQISGTVSPYTTHYIGVRELKANTSYYFTLGTGSGSKFDNNGEPYTVKTAVQGGNPGPALTIYGNVQSAQGEAASGAIVYADLDGIGKLSSLVKDSGSWSIPLSSARVSDGSAYAKVDNSASVALTVQGTQANVVANSTVAVANAQPAPAITLGVSTVTVTENTENISVSPSPTAEVSEGVVSEPSPSPSPTLLPSPTLEPATSNGQIVNIQSSEQQVVDTAQPTIVGTAPANVKINIQIHSATEITSQVQADAEGGYSLDLSELAKTLEPGTHTVTISYIDPQTGKTVTQKRTFTVAATTSPSVSPQPYGSSNPYTVTDATPTPSPTETATTITNDVDRSTMPASASSLPTSGSTETTVVLVGLGLLFMVAGGWSFALSRQKVQYLTGDTND